MPCLMMLKTTLCGNQVVVAHEPCFFAKNWSTHIRMKIQGYEEPAPFEVFEARLLPAIDGS